VRAHPGRRRAVVTDTVFSMNGDRAPLRALSALCAQHELALFVDEAHATGVLGARGRGLTELEGVTPDVHVGTLSKALGCFGAYVAGSAALREVLIKALATDREQRWPSAAAFTEALHAVQNKTKIETPTVKTTWRCKWCDTVNPLSDHDR
jgi:7-keto-8-aminopelargonate synthetase-like enzyme